MEKSVKKSAISIVAIFLVMILLLIIASVLTPFLLRISGLKKIDSSIFFINRLFIWLVLILLWLYTKYFEKQRLLIWADSKRTIRFYISSVSIILGALFIGNVVIATILNLIIHNETSRKFLEYIGVLKNNIPLLIFTIFTAAVVEELIFRGFIQTRLERLLKSSLGGILVSSFLFAVVHLSYGTLSNFIVPFFIGIIFSFFYWKYKNIKVLIICHFIWDAIALFLSIKSH